MHTLLSNMTVRLSWTLVLVTFSGLTVAACATGLYALDKSGALVASAADGAAQQRFDTFADLARWALIAILVITALTVAVVAWGVSANVLRPLSRLVGYFERMADGDLNQSITAPGNNEIGRLYLAMAAMQGALSQTVGVVRQSGTLIFERAHDIASSNGDLSARTEQQASSLEETASSMEELASTVNHNADNARQASRLASDATLTARQSGEEVSRIVETMEEISSSSHRVADIITLIDTIAFQTNILALNASVEAARAGEHGRGFAVVAQEVRSLASRSASAAQEIRTLIDTSLAKVDSGTARVNQAGETMQGLVSAVQRVSDIMDEIASASSEQSNGIGQVNQAVTQMDDVVQQNARLVQQAAERARELEGDAARLRDAVVRFKVAEGGGHGAAPIAKPALPAAPVVRAKPVRSAPAVEEWEAF